MRESLEYIHAGKRITLLNKDHAGNFIYNKGWKPCTQKQAEQFRGAGAAWVLGENDLVIDVDPRNGGLASWEKLCSDYNINADATVCTARNGFHIYMQTTGQTPIKKKLSDYPGIDFLSKGSLAVIPGSVNGHGTYKWHDDNILDGFYTQDAPQALLDDLQLVKTAVTHKKEDLGDFEGLIGGSDTSEQQVRSWLRVLDPDIDHDAWIRVGMALHHWHPTDGLKLWRLWSKGGDKFLPGECERRWKSFGGREKGIKTGTLAHMATDAVADIKDDDDSWTKQWVYVNAYDAYVQLNTGNICSTTSFNVQNGKYIPANAKGGKISAHKMVSDWGLVEVVDNTAYMPTIEDRIFSIGGVKYVNTFRPSTVPEYSGTVENSESQEAIDLIRAHISLIFGANAPIFEQWLAWQVQHMGEKLLWAPIVQGCEGIGKSFFGELLEKCIGLHNVGTVFPAQAISSFNGWAVGACVNIMSELRIKGHNRYEAVNALKPLITDSMVQINEKCVKPYVTLNTTNYICFTNYKDAVPMAEGDRRWWVIFVEHQSREELVEAAGSTVADYFPRLFTTMREHAPALQHWLRCYHITDEFRDMKQAPMTSYKQMVIESEKVAHEGLEEAEMLLKEGGELFNQDMLCSAPFFDALALDYPELHLNTLRKNLLLKEMGFMPYGQCKIGGANHRVWTKKSTDADAIRKVFNK